VTAVAAVLVLLAAGTCCVRPRGLLVPRRWRQRWRATVRRGVRGKHDRIRGQLRRRVLAADCNRCVACGATARSSGHPLQVDHIVPWIMGGLTWRRNLATLCRPCNGMKGIYWVSPAGTVYYHATWGRSSRAGAEMIHAAEIRARRSPARLLRSARVA
jgi:5-methylcytosine-specific restriction endonuclease McrA